MRKDADKVAEKMEELIEEVKHRAERVAVSSVIKRYDGRVPPSKIASYNYLMYHICLKHNIYYFDNDDMVKSLLNHSNLHLNKVGDKALGSAFCTFLKSRLAGHHMKEWTNYRKHVSQANENVGSDFFTSLNSIPNERGFKMAFLNIVSLPKKIDEIRYSMSNKHIDLIGFSET